MPKGLMLAAAMAAITSSAALAEYIESDGVAYEISMSRGVAVVSPFITADPQPDAEYRGVVRVSAQVEYDGKTYPVTGVSKDAFAGSGELTGVVLPESLVFIDDYAFSSCVSLSDVDIPAGVRRIGRNAFAGCTSLTSMALPENVKAVPAQAFYGCAALAGISMPASLTSIGDGAFSGCGSLSDMTIPESVAEIGDGAFRNCRSLTSVDIPAGISVLGEGAFENCSSLSRAGLPGNIGHLPAYLFSGCHALGAITLSESVESVGDYAFQGCTSLRELVVPSSLTSIGAGAFNLCTSLSSLSFEKGDDEGDLLSIGSGAFSSCPVSALELWRVETLGEEAFANCSALKSVFFPAETRTIAAKAFHNCPAISEVTSYSLVPPVLNNIAFDRQTYSDAMLTVVDSAELLYRQTSPWNNFMHLNTVSGALFPGEDDNPALGVRLTTSGLEISAASGEYSVYDSAGRLVMRRSETAMPSEVSLGSKGVYIVVSGGSSLKVVF